MADFVHTMKDWRRMCKAQNDTICGECSSCPMGDDGKSCMAVYEDEFDSVDFAHIEQTVAEWAAEHPEPVYPTWAEWLNSMGLIKHDTGQFCVHMPNQYSYKVKEVDILNEVAYKPIPDDKAQKLGIEPKEG